ncbi:MAG: putative nucleotide sugar epimerase [Phycisphaerales bacterium]|nr:putative nucleotide sugar epimerase [Phycisphaerales bacterium]
MSERVGQSNRRRICFVTGTRADFGLMRSVIRAIKDHPALELQLAVTGMHLDRSRGYTIDSIRAEKWKIDAVVPWSRGDGGATAAAAATGKAVASLASLYDKLGSDVVIVVGDRVEAFAAASAAHVSDRLVAHVHGGDRALGQVDDSLRHAITKLAHIHFPATTLSARRLGKLGEDRWRIFTTGAPGLDDIRTSVASRTELSREFPGFRPRRYALLVLHPQTPDVSKEASAARLLLKTVEACDFEHIVIVYPNTDPGADGIASVWAALPDDARRIVRRDISRPLFLGLMRDAAVLVGNSSAGIIEAASFGTPVVDVGARERGREHGPNVIHSPFKEAALRKCLARIWNSGTPIRFPARNPYGAGGTGRRIAANLARIRPERFLRKLISY